MPSPRGEPPEPESPSPRSAEEIFVAAYELARRGDPGLWPRAMRLFEQAAARGHTEAQSALALALRDQCTCAAADGYETKSSNGTLPFRKRC